MRQAGRLLLSCMVFLVASGEARSFTNTELLSFYSPSRGVDIDFVIFTPPGYQNGSERYPVLYFLHGISGNQWLYWGGIATSVPEANGDPGAWLGTLMTDGVIPPMIIVTPDDADGHWGATNETMITQELISHIDSNWRTIPNRQGRAIEGFSMGGMGASTYGSQHSDLYCSTIPMGAPSSGTLIPQWEQNQQAVLANRLAVRLVVGSDDPQLESMTSLHNSLTSLGIPHEWEVVPGVPHNFGPLYNAVGIEGLQFHGDCFENGPIAETRLLLVGLGEGASGWGEALRPSAPHDHDSWLRVNWSAYHAAVGETRPASCDLDADGKDEIVLGLGSYPASGGWLEVKDDAETSFAHLAWLRVNWSTYNAANGESFPACGDLDGDGKDEIVVGLGAGGQGWLKVFDDAGAGFVALPGTPKADGWIRLGWTDYNTTVGEVHPAVGNLDQDARDEIVLGLAGGGGGFLQVLDDAPAGFAALPGTPVGGGWVRIEWPLYDGSNGETWPAVGDLNGDGRGELVIGLGAGGRGFVRVLADASGGFAPVAGTPKPNGWLHTSWNTYNNAVGSAFPAVGDLDGDGREELILGLGTYPANGGWVEIREDLAGGLASSSWAHVNWSSYNAANGLTRPVVLRR